MGIYDREYYRDGNRDRLSDWFGQRGTVWLVAVTCGVFAAQLLTAARPGDARTSPLTEWGVFSAEAILHGEVWRLVTPVFLHADPVHLIFNAIILYCFGAIIEGVYGTREFVCFYLAAGLAGGLAEFAARASGLLDPRVTSLGASGAVTAVMVLFACHFPHRRLYVWFLIPAPAWVVVAGLVALDTLGVLGRQRDGINHAAHLFGAAAGAAYYFSHMRVSNWIPRVGGLFAGRPARPRLRLVPAAESETPTPRPPRAAPTPEPQAARPAGKSLDEQLEAKLDYVLEKVSQYGKASLTPEENALLMRASEIYKRRRGG